MTKVNGPIDRKLLLQCKLVSGLNSIGLICYEFVAQESHKKIHRGYSQQIYVTGQFTPLERTVNLRRVGVGGVNGMIILNAIMLPQTVADSVPT